MAAIKKFGTFAGVFTPSILTILGVIMYLRLPWIVGQSGIYTTIGIILVAHLVSITTGLSVSSIATDKKVKAGGTYFIISRSMGLPIGGTLGIALFMGLSMSVSLYIIGFSESFLGYFGYSADKDTIRITGTIVLAAVTILTFISTSLAIKTQFIIMSAIILSLISILFGSNDFQPAAPSYEPFVDMPSFIFIFAIFFPAVTGFEAGVSMSGDLKDSKKSIPGGTIAAIVIGLVVYIGLTFFLGYYVDAEQLRNNPNILLDISFFAPLVIAGIWGATISSAIGSILGAPRILQATSNDNITPKPFAKGKGKENEPRNALLLTFIIAEIGILIGELNLIARIVSMFFITTYGFLNLSCALENWASTDFRPSFKIPIWVSALGSIVCFILMIELDFIAFIGATILMTSLFAYLKRKELTLESGDTWEGIWSSILRSSLYRLDNTVKQQRNWRPNILLFSLDENTDSTMTKIGRWLVNKRGIISMFKIQLTQNGSDVISRPNDITTDETEYDGIFQKTIKVSDYHDAIDNISKLYGFSGLEPNTVMMRWSHDQTQQTKLQHLIKNLESYDLNILMVYENKKRDEQKFKSIDIIWDQDDNMIPMSLSVFKFLSSETDWQHGSFRIIIINEHGSDHDKIYRNAQSLLEEQRFDIEIKIINNLIEKRTKFDIIREFSILTDLVIVELPEQLPFNDATRFSDFKENLSQLNTILFVKPSNFFNEQSIGLAEPKQVSVESESLFSSSIELNVLPKEPVLKTYMENLFNDIKDLAHSLNSELIAYTSSKFAEITTEIATSNDKLVGEIKDIETIEEQFRRTKKLNQIKTNYQYHLLLNFKERLDSIFQEIFNNAAHEMERYKKRFNEIIDTLPEDVHITYQPTDELYADLDTTLIEKIFKNNKTIYRTTDLREIVSMYSMIYSRKVMSTMFRAFGFISYSYFAEIQKIINNNNDILDRFDTEQQDIEPIITRINELSSEIGDIQQSHISKIVDSYFKSTNMVIENMSKDMSSLHTSTTIQKKLRIASKNRYSHEILENALESWKDITHLLMNEYSEIVHIKIIINRLDVIISRLKADFNIFFDQLDKMLDELMQRANDDSSEAEKVIWQNKMAEIRNLEGLINELDHDLIEVLENIPSDLTIFSEQETTFTESNIFEAKETIEVNLKRFTRLFIDYEIMDAITKTIREQVRHLNEINEDAIDITRFINYNLMHSDDATVGDEMTQSRSQSRIEQTISTLREQTTNFNTEIDTILENIRSRFIGSEIHKQSNSSMKMSTFENNLIRGKISNFFTSIQEQFKRLGAKFVYSRSEGVIFYRRLGRTDDKPMHQAEKNIEYLKPFLMNSKLMNSLPHFYTKLFYGNHPVSSEFLVERKDLMESAKSSVMNYREGFLGGLLILGHRLSGKSTFSEMVARKHFDKYRIYEITPDATHRNNAKSLTKKLGEAFESRGSIDDIFENMQTGNVVIFHDLEMWWTRSTDGGNHIEEILRIIKTYSSKCFFIVNISMTSYQLMRQLFDFDQTFIKTIYCEPFDAENIENAIQKRHKASGVKYLLDDKSEDDISTLRSATLFNNIFKISRGNVGLSLITWMTFINGTNQDQIVLRERKVKDNIDDFIIPDKWVNLIMQIIIHKEIRKDDLEKIMMIESNEFSMLCSDMLRNHIIIEKEPDVYTVNLAINHLIMYKLKEMGLI